MARDIVVIGGSAGGLEALKPIAHDLPPDLPAAVLVVLHIPATAKSALAMILSRSGGLRAVTPRDGDALRPGYIYVPTPDHHLELTPDRIRVTRGPRVNGMRPAVDVLFRTAADTFGPRVAAVVLSGGLDDGSAGLAAVRAAGGVGLVQSPDDAMIESMPRNAIELAEPEHVLPAAKIGSMLVRLVQQPAKEERRPVKQGGVAMEAVGARDTPGEVTGITCPECHGSIWLKNGDGGDASLTCRVGHAFSPESFYEVQSQNVENALWAGVRSLEEQASLAGVMAARASKFEDRDASRRYERRREIANENADALRKVILDRSDA
jgi:two-component system, chemotaxis family, protein-glutamate methylesterase/glutaminase